MYFIVYFAIASIAAYFGVKRWSNHLPNRLTRSIWFRRLRLQPRKSRSPTPTLDFVESDGDTQKRSSATPVIKFYLRTITNHVHVLCLSSYNQLT